MIILAKKKKEDDDKYMGALFIPAGIFIGLGYGFFQGNVPGGLFYGLGGGFVAFVLSAMLIPRKK